MKFEAFYFELGFTMLIAPTRYHAARDILQSQKPRYRGPMYKEARYREV